MSLHAQLSPEAMARLQAQRRNSTISSIVISILVIVLIGLVLGLFLLPLIPKEVPVLVTYEVPEDTEPKPEEKPKKTVDNKPTPTSTSMAKVIATTAPTNVTIPVPEVEIDAPSLEFGDSLEFSQNWGGSNSFTSIPASMKKRCSESDRISRLKEMGGSVKCEKAVVKALQYIKGTQNDDGSWGEKHRAAMTGMAILAYLGHCETPKSAEYGNSITKGITYLINMGMKGDGMMATEKGISAVYEHAIATYALSEAYTFCKELKIDIPNLKNVTMKAGEKIIDGQSPAGGWNYKYGKAPTGDNSVGFWQIQALKAFKTTGILADSKFRKTSEDAIKFLEKVQGQNGAIGYREDPKRSPGLTGGAALCMQFWGQGDSKACKKAIEYVRKNTQFEWGKPSSNLYYHYYNAQAMINAGGEDWKWYNKLFQDQLLNAQHSDGSWKQKMSHGPVNDHMATCLATFMLEVYYRFLPGTKTGH